MTKDQKELLDKFNNNLHAIHQDIVSKVSNGDALRKIQTELEEEILQVNALYKDLKDSIVGNEFHVGLREVVQKLEKEIKHLNDFAKTAKIKGGMTKKDKGLVIGGFALLEIIEVIKEVLNSNTTE